MGAKTEKPQAIVGQVWLVFIIIFGIAIILSATKAFSLMARSRQVTLEKNAVSDARQVGLALTEFTKRHGSFPNNSTAAIFSGTVQAAYGFAGTSSNALFRQLFASQIVDSEYTFHVKTRRAKKPDNIITPGNVLEPKSCGFSYISGISTKDDPRTPIVLTPLIPGTTRLDPKPFKGNAIVVFVDNTVRTYKIHKDGHIYDKGIDLLSPKHPIWKGKAPDIRYPE